MNITFGPTSYLFTAWRPDRGRVFDRGFAFDCETTLIDDAHPWITPAYVLGAAFDGERGYFVPRDHAAAFWRIHAALPVVFHNAAFDLSVLQLLDPTLDVYAAVDHNRVWDTWLLHRLYSLATVGHTAEGHGQSTLETCAKNYLGVELPKDLVDPNGNTVRTSYGRFLNRPPADIPPVYLDYLARDTIATFQIHHALRRRIRELLACSQSVWGYVSEEWMSQCTQRWGPLTHHIQLRAAIVLREIGANGLHIDQSLRDHLVPELEHLRSELESRLREHGVIAKGTGSQAAMQAKFAKLASRHPEIPFPRTESGRFATDADTLHELASTVPFVDDLLKYRAVDKLLGTFLTKLSCSVIHPSFGVLTRTGRTSSFGEINAQNLPRDERVRNCFVPSPGHVFLDLDYSTIELVALAQACMTQLGLPSAMADRINANDDLHRVFAGFVTGKRPDEVTKSERNRVKPINFGKPGGMGDRALQRYAKATYGIAYTDDEVTNLSNQWFELFPEMRTFLEDAVNTPYELARWLGLTPRSFAEFTDSDRFLEHPDNHDREDEPHEILGMMALKVFGHEHPTRRNGEPYSDQDRAYFWTCLDGAATEWPQKYRDWIRMRIPSKQLQCYLAFHVGRAGVFTLTGRLRAQASFTARHNTIFQGLTADGAKLAMWRIWRAGYRIVNFIHDEFLIEVSEQSDLSYHAEQLRSLMIEGMREVIPEIKVRVDCAASRCWSKSASAMYNQFGQLCVTEPVGEMKAC